MMTIPLALLLAAAAPPAVPHMDHAAASCPAVAAPLPAELAGWSRRMPARAAATASRATALPIGEGVVATLLRSPEVAYAVPPGKPAGPDGSGGLFAFTVPAAGRYRVALGSAAWIDVLAGSIPAISVAHAHGPACSEVRKLVDFDLRPGRHLLQIAGSASPRLPLMIVRLGPKARPGSPRK